MLTHWYTKQSYWTARRSNFGDMLSPVMFRNFSGVDPEWALPEDSELVGIGSILQRLPAAWPGTVVGTGKLRAGYVPDLSQARVLALRGALTAPEAGLDVPLGDPGLLVSRVVSRAPVRFPVGLVPHWSDSTLVNRFEGETIWPVTTNPMAVVHKISMCERIISSSLHGIIVADAFGIPRRAEYAKQFDEEGGRFKFDDYASTIGVSMKFGEWQMVPSANIESVQRALIEAFGRV